MRTALLAVAVIAWGAPVAAQPTGDPGALFDKLAAAELDQLRQAPFEEARADGTAKREIEHSDAKFRNIAVETPAVDPASGLTAAERAAAVVSTSVDGAEAGVIVAPLAFARRDALRGVTVTVAAFDGGVTRLGAGYVYELRGTPRFEDLKLRCPLDEGAVKRSLAATREAFVRTCSAVVAKIEAPALRCDAGSDAGDKAACKVVADAGKAACGFDQPFASRLDPPTTVTAAKGSIQALLDRAQRATFVVPLDERNAVRVLGEFQPPRPLDCATSNRFDAAVTRWVWKQPTHKFSVAGFVDLFPLTLGHNPDMLADVENKQREVRFDWVRAKRGLEIGAGIAWSTEREGRGTALVGSVRPSFRIAMVAGTLDGKPLEEGGELRTTGDGALPPIVIVGVKGELGLATDPPDSDDTTLRDLKLTVHVDFRYTENLAFRIGVPIAMKRVAGMTDPTNIGNQWTLPVFVATVLKL